MSQFTQNPRTQPPDAYEHDYTVEVTFKLAVDAYDAESAKHLGQQMAAKMASAAGGAADCYEIDAAYREQ
ncbi:MAG: hypothetical protein ACIAQU_04240 [Phycisphaerales bacterium JB064]